MNSQDILWKIIHERDVTKFDRIIPLLHEIGLENKPEEGRGGRGGVGAIRPAAARC